LSPGFIMIGQGDYFRSRHAGESAIQVVTIVTPSGVANNCYA
jgi:hypothetical protein